MTPAHTIPAERLADALHYLSARTVSHNLGLVRLYKALWLADVLHFRRTGRTITGATAYQKQRLGPVPNGALKAISTLGIQGKAQIFVEQTPMAPMKMLVALTEPSVEAFTPYEIHAFSVALDVVRNMTADEASEMTHDALWKEIAMAGQIPVASAAIGALEEPCDDEVELAAAGCNLLPA